MNNYKYSGADWIEKSLKVSNMSPLGKEVADLLGDLFLGIYHLQSSTLNKVEWSRDSVIRVAIGTNMATFDNDIITRLVVLSHDRMLRVEIVPCNFNYLVLLISKRTIREGDCFDKMPTMENHIRLIRDAYAIKAI